MQPNAFCNVSDNNVSLKAGVLAIALDNRGSTGIRANDVVVVLPQGMKFLEIKDYAPNPATKIGGTFRCLFIKVYNCGEIEVNWLKSERFGDEEMPFHNVITVSVT